MISLAQHRMPTTSAKNCIILFVKYPQPGKVKTRLSKDIGPDKAAVLYTCFINDILASLSNINADIHIYYNPPNTYKKFKAWMGTAYSYSAQRGNNLGERMNNAFFESFKKGYSKTVIIGSDSPDLPVRILKKAFSSLKTNDAVFGPAYDGGYYLIGFKKSGFFSGIFKGIPWSTEQVLKKTRSKLKKAGIKTSMLTRWRDVDTLRDLKNLFKRNNTLPWRRSHTMRYLKNKN